MPPVHAFWGRDFSRMQGWSFAIILAPHPNPPGFLCRGLHLELWLDWNSLPKLRVHRVPAIEVTH